MTDLGAIKQLHATLYDRYLTSRSSILADPKAFTKEADDLTQSMEAISADVTCLEDYEWLRGAVEKWRSVFVSSLRIPRDISLAAPRMPLRSATPREERTIWADGDLEHWVRIRALELAKNRAVRRHDAMTPEEMLRQWPSTPEEEKEDWDTAHIHLACEILDGKIGLTQLRPRSYIRLEACWLEDIKRLKAYYIWVARGSRLDTHRAVEDYYDACRQIQARVLGAEGKRPESEFGLIRQYLEKHYLVEDKTDPAKVKNLIAAKARRICEKTGHDDLENRRIAEAYVQAFYDNIVPAVCAADADASQRIAEVVDVCASDDGRHLIINALEVAVAASFVNAGAALRALAGAAA